MSLLNQRLNAIYSNFPLWQMCNNGVQGKEITKGRLRRRGNAHLEAYEFKNDQCSQLTYSTICMAKC